MLRYMIRRLLWAVVLFLAVTLVTYVIFFLVPANPAARICGGERARTTTSSRSRRVPRPRPAGLRAVLEVPQSARARQDPRQVVRRPRRRSTTIIGDAAPVTASLVFGGAIFWMLIALPSASSPRCGRARS